MAKAASPVRLEQSLMEAATVSGSLLHRSAAEQVEYWADIGRKVSNVITPDTLLAIKSGLLRIRVEEVEPIRLNPDDVFANLDRDRSSGALSEAIQSNTIRYQASKTHPGMLEQIHPDGTSIIGQFKNGQFIALDK